MDVEAAELPRHTGTVTPAATAAFTCPACGWQGSFDPRFVAWCSQCRHNADPAAPKDTGKRAARRQAKARRQGEALFETLRGRGELNRPGSPLRVLAMAISLGVHLLSLVLLAGSVALVLSIHSLPARVLGAFGVIVALWTGPRVPRMKRGDAWLTRAQAPATFGLLDRACAVLDAPVPARVGRYGSFNAYTTRCGLRGRPVVMIGRPLWHVLDGRERLALLGHELAHSVNGDTFNGVFGGLAARSLTAWRYLFDPSTVRRPGPRIRRRGDLNGIAEMFAPLIMLPFYLCFLGLDRLHRRVWLRLSPRAEYHADALAARLGGTDALASKMEKIMAAESVHFILTHGTGSASERLRRLSDYLATLPEHERQRQLVVGELRGTAVDASHPPTHLRRALALELTRQPAAFEVSEDEWRRIDAELFAGFDTVS